VLVAIFSRQVYEGLADTVLSIHVLFILWVVFGALLTRDSRLLRWFHIASLIWGVAVEVLPWPCPLTILENWLESRARVQPYQGGFLLHYLDALVYPNLSPLVLTIAAVAVCAVNLGIYVRRLVKTSTSQGLRP
jgi:hypothetical protein